MNKDMEEWLAWGEMSWKMRIRRDNLGPDHREPCSYEFGLPFWGGCENEIEGRRDRHIEKSVRS